MPVAKYNPFADLDELPGVRLFQDTLNRFLSEPNTARPWSPAVDIYETDNDLVIKADLPEVTMSDIDISLENGTLTLKGERKFEKAENNKGFHRIERSYGSFIRLFSVPETVDSENVHAAYNNGVLTVTLPKKERAKPKAIKVQVNNN